MSEAATLSMVENSLSDILFHVENEGIVPDFTNWRVSVTHCLSLPRKQTTVTLLQVLLISYVFTVKALCVKCFDQLCVHIQGFVFTFKALCVKCCWSTMCSHSRLCVHIQGFVFTFKALFGNNLMLRLQDNQTSWRHKKRHPDSKTDSHQEVVWQRNMTVERKQWQMETAVVNVYAVWTKMM